MNTKATRPTAPVQSDPMTEISRMNMRIVKLEQQLYQLVEMLQSYQKVHHGQQAVLRGWSDKVSQGVDKR